MVNNSETDWIYVAKTVSSFYCFIKIFNKSLFIADCQPNYAFSSWEVKKCKTWLENTPPPPPH